MDENKKGIYRIILIAILIISLGMLFFENVDAITGKVVESSTPSNVSIQKYLAVSLCSNLSQGISFGTVDNLPATDINGTHNYDGVSNATTYCVNVSQDGNTPIDICVKGDGPLNTTGGDKIGLENETYANWTSTDASLPSLSNETSINETYLKSGINIGAGSFNYYRFWLDIPSAQPAGEYNNTIFFKGVQTTFNCV